MNAAGPQLPPDIAVRKARWLAAPSLGQAISDSFEDYRSFAPSEWQPSSAATQAELLQDLLAESDYWCVVAEQRGALVGQVAFLPATRAHLAVADPALAHLRQLFVRRDQWATGLATALHAMVRTEAAARGYSEMRLLVPAGQARARRFYEREGWTLTRGPFEGGFGLATHEYRCSLAEG